LQTNDLIGIPFIDGGRDPNIGLDCWGLFILAMKRYGNNIPDYSVMAFDTDKIVSTMAVAVNMWQKCNTPQEGLGVSFAINPQFPDITQHFGVCLNCNKFLHTRSKTGSVIERFDNAFWSKKITGFWKWQG